MSGSRRKRNSVSSSVDTPIMMERQQELKEESVHSNGKKGVVSVDENESHVVIPASQPNSDDDSPLTASASGVESYAVMVELNSPPPTVQENRLMRSLNEESSQAIALTPLFERAGSRAKPTAATRSKSIRSAPIESPSKTPSANHSIATKAEMQERLKQMQQRNSQQVIQSPSKNTSAANSLPLTSASLSRGETILIPDSDTEADGGDGTSQQQLSPNKRYSLILSPSPPADSAVPSSSSTSALAVSSLSWKTAPTKKEKSSAELKSTNGKATKTTVKASKGKVKSRRRSPTPTSDLSSHDSDYVEEKSLKVKPSQRKKKTIKEDSEDEETEMEQSQSTVKSKSKSKETSKPSSTLQQLWSKQKSIRSLSSDKDSTRTYSLSLSQSTAASQAADEIAIGLAAAEDRKRISPRKRYRSVFDSTHQSDLDEADDEVLLLEEKPKSKSSNGKNSIQTAVDQSEIHSKKRTKLSHTLSGKSGVLKRGGSLHNSLQLVPAPTTHGPSALSTTQSSGTIPSSQSRGPPSVLWIDKYAPRTEDDLCVNPKKVKEIKQWMQQFMPPRRIPATQIRNHGSMRQTAASSSVAQPSPHGETMLILVGPAGSAKTALVRVLAESMGYSILAWDDEDDQEPFVAKGEFSNNAPIERGTRYQPYESKLDRFRKFFSLASRYSMQWSLASSAKDTTAVTAASALVSNPQLSHAASSSMTSTPITSGLKSVVVLEELPFLNFEEDDPRRKEFLFELKSCLPQALCPIILLLTTEHESKSGEYLVEQLFGKDFVTHRNVGIIPVNPVTSQGMAKALNRVIEGERLEYSDDAIDALIQQSRGDVRYAIQALQFHAVSHSAFNGSFELDPNAKSKPKRRRKKKGDDNGDGQDGRNTGLAVPSLFSERDECFSRFHSIGKILHAKPDESRDVRNIIESSDIESPVEFLEWIFSNYLEYMQAPIKPQGIRYGGNNNAAQNPKPNPNPKPSKPSFFDDDDMDGDAFDQVMNSIGVKKSETTKSFFNDFDSPQSVAVDTSQSSSSSPSQEQLDAMALQAIVEASANFSDADILAKASAAQYGDSVAALEEMAAAEVGVRGYMHSKRECGWSKEDQKIGFQTQRGPMSYKVYRLQQQKRYLFHDLFLKFPKEMPPLELDLLMNHLQMRTPVNNWNGEQLATMREFAGRDFLLPSASSFLENLPYLHVITANAPRNQQAVPSSQPQYVQQVQPRSNANWIPQQQQQSVASSPPPPPAAFPVNQFEPLPSELQQLFLENLATYHPRTTVDQLVKEQTKAFEKVQIAQRREAAISRKQDKESHAIATSGILPTAEILEEIEDIEEFED